MCRPENHLPSQMLSFANLTCERESNSSKKNEIHIKSFFFPCFDILHLEQFEFQDVKQWKITLQGTGTSDT